MRAKIALRFTEAVSHFFAISDGGYRAGDTLECCKD